VATFANVGISGTAGTSYTLTFASGALTAATQAITPTVGAASKLLFLSQPPNTTAAATMGTFQVAVTDAADNVVTSDNATDITIAISTNPSGGALTGTATVTVINGVASFSTLSINLAGTGYRFTATSNPAFTAAISNLFNIL
jgi:hypothetical protein